MAASIQKRLQSFKVQDPMTRSNLYTCLQVFDYILTLRHKFFLLSLEEACPTNLSNELSLQKCLRFAWQKKSDHDVLSIPTENLFVSEKAIRIYCVQFLAKPSEGFVIH